MPEPSSPTTIKLEHVSVSFPIYQSGSRSLKKAIISRGTAGRIARDANDRIVVDALRDISFRLGPGDRVALIGNNGAGKTTLLRVIARIYEPVVGSVEVVGRISPMFDIGLGIDNDLSGYENIRTQGLLLGMTPREIESRLESIAAFTELGAYLQMPARTYSAGMRLRLSFGVATCFEPEVLLIDEWIFAGDMHFMAKARERINSFVDRASVLVLASHNLEICRQLCKTAIWLDNGTIRGIGAIDDVVRSYQAAAP